MGTALRGHGAQRGAGPGGHRGVPGGALAGRPAGHGCPAGAGLGRAGALRGHCPVAAAAGAGTHHPLRFLGGGYHPGGDLRHLHLPRLHERRGAQARFPRAWRGRDTHRHHPRRCHRRHADDGGHRPLPRCRCSFPQLHAVPGLDKRWRAGGRNRSGRSGCGKHVV